jgi:seryl-tRNA(Sec) selenium transferase
MSADPQEAEKSTLDRLATLAFAADGAVAASSLEAAVTLAAAAFIAGTEPGRIARLPDVAGPCAIVLQKGHAVRLGAPLTTLLRLAGAVPVEVGTVESCEAHELAAALDDAAVGAISHVGTASAVGALLDPASMSWACRRAGKPLLVVDAASGGWAAWLDTGAALVALDVAAGVGGAEGGLLIGRRPWIEAALAQCSGIGAALVAGPRQRAAIEAAIAARWPAGRVVLSGASGRA